MSEFLTHEATTQNRITTAWECILEQHFALAKKVTNEEGEGLNIFKLLRAPEKENYNCQYFYTEKNSPAWKKIFSLCSEGDRVLEIYDQTSMILICIQVPLGEEGNNTTGNMRLFDIETGAEVSLLKTADISKELEKLDVNDIQLSNGIHKRTVHAT